MSRYYMPSLKFLGAAALASVIAGVLVSYELGHAAELRLVRVTPASPEMKTLLVGIALAVGMVLATQAFASDVTDCPHIVWTHGHYVYVIEDNS